MTEVDFLRPIKIWGYFFIAMSIVCVLMHVSLLQNQNYTMGFMYFVLITAFIHLLVGVGVICKKKWGFSFFKFYLYALYPAIPIGTYLAKNTFEYIEKHHIEKFFK